MPIQKTTGTVYDVLRAIQLELKAPKDMQNNFGKYKYRNVEGILEQVKPLLASNNATLILADELVNIGDRYYVKATATLHSHTDSVSVSAFAREEEDKKGMDGSQITGASSSYARKYALCGLFLIDASEDSDATSTKTKQSDKEYEAKQIWKQYFAKIKVENPDKVADSAIWDMYSQILLRECSVSPANATDEHYVKFIAYCNGKINS